VNDNLRRKWS